MANRHIFACFKLCEELAAAYRIAERGARQRAYLARSSQHIHSRALCIGMFWHWHWSVLVGRPASRVLAVYCLFLLQRLQGAGYADVHTWAQFEYGVLSFKA